MTDTPAPGDEELSGWLEKRGAVNTSWKKRWFDLKESKLVYRKKPSDPASKGVIELSGSSIAQLNPEEGDWQYRITIATPAGRTYVLRAKLAEVKMWLPVLQARASAAPAMSASPLKRKGTINGFSGNPLGMISMEEAISLSRSKGRRALKYGFLEKKGEQRKKWRWRWFELRESRLDYYRHPGDNSPRGSVALRDSDVTIEHNVQDSSTTQKGFIFLDITPLVSQRVYRMRGESVSVTAWADVLKERVTTLASDRGSSGLLIADGIDQAPDELLLSYDRDEDFDAEDDVLIQSGQLVEQKDVKHALNAEKIRKRDAAMEQIEGDVHLINEMMTDIAGLVSDQGRQLDDIEMSMDATGSRVSDGVAQLHKASGKKG